MELIEVAFLLWEWCNREKIVPVASHSPGEDFLLADFLSLDNRLPRLYSRVRETSAFFLDTFPSSLEGLEDFRFSTIQVDPSFSQEVQGGSDNGGLDCSLLAGSGRVFRIFCSC